MATASKGPGRAAIRNRQHRAAALGCFLSEDPQLSVHGPKCEMVRETHTRKPKAVSRGRRESVKARKERLELERLAAARFEFEHGPQRRMVLVMASDPEEAVEMAVAQATAGDWRLRASVPKVKGEYTVEFLGSDRWMVPVTVKLPAKQLDSWPNWH